MITEYEAEPIPGLPGLLPRGEHILWQGKPDRRALAHTAFHTRLIAGYFALLAAISLVTALIRGDSMLGVGMTVGFGVIGVILLEGLAFATARSTVYTLTNRRIVMRIGIALPKCINLPLGIVGAVDMNLRPDGNGDLPLTSLAKQQMGYVSLWPHVRAWHVAEPQPMLRAIVDAHDVGALIARTCQMASVASNVVQIDSVRVVGSEAVAA